MKKFSYSLMYKYVLKRVIDFILVLIILVVVGPILLLITIWLHFANKGAGAFFTQERPGKDGKIFRVIKFKTMTDERDTDGNLLPDAQRLTKVGRFVRSTSIDELPQLLNVLKGDMSLVGPRPHMLKHTEEYSHLINKYMVRHFVKPGITGWAQVTGFRGETKELWQMEGRVQRDIWYIEHWTFLLDLYIMYKTVYNVIRGDKEAY
mgnify:CR=1 FL=1